jgi:hypothetical protein
MLHASPPPPLHLHHAHWLWWRADAGDFLNESDGGGGSGGDGDGGGSEHKGGSAGGTATSRGMSTGGAAGSVLRSGSTGASPSGKPGVMTTHKSFLSAGSGGLRSASVRSPPSSDGGDGSSGGMGGVTGAAPSTGMMSTRDGDGSIAPTPVAVTTAELFEAANFMSFSKEWEKLKTLKVVFHK